jgi:SanA protein
MELGSPAMAEWATLAAGLGIVSLSWATLWIPRALPRRIRGRCYDRVEEVPWNRVALVLGCTQFLDGGAPNIYFQFRIEAAVALYREGKVDKLLVSGASHRRDVDEAGSMKDALIEAGVKETDIVCDRDGYRTIDSVIRAQSAYGLDRLTIISQAFHNRRAIYIAEHWGIDAIGFNAEDVRPPRGRKVRFREHFARLRTVIDLYILATQPRVAGPSSPI